MSDRDVHEVVIVGAGAAGLSVAAMLARHGVSALVLEREEEVGMSWARRYESLRLNTPRLLSYLPRYHMPRRYGRWPSRDQLVEYLRDYARQLGLRVMPRTLHLVRLEPGRGRRQQRYRRLRSRPASLGRR